MTRAEALKLLADENYCIPSGRPYVMAAFSPQDAWAVARLFFAVYGNDYPVDNCYCPQQLIEEHTQKRYYGSIARTPEGDVVAHSAMYFGGAPFSRLFECGMALSHPDYRDTTVMFQAVGYCNKYGYEFLNACAGYAEWVTTSTATQKLGRYYGLIETGVEVGLMPTPVLSLSKDGQKRTTCVLAFRSIKDKKMPLFLPKPYAVPLQEILASLPVERDVQNAVAALPVVAHSRIKRTWFGVALTERFNVFSVGRDFESASLVLEKTAIEQGARALQARINLADAHVEHAVAILKARGWFFGGLAPRWFDSDALLMQRCIPGPDFSGITLVSNEAKRILAHIQADVAEL
jgi:hypothetical protein